MTISSLQFEALTALMNSRSATLHAALRDVMTTGATQKEAAAAHSVRPASLSRAVREARNVIGLCVTLITNQPTDVPSLREGATGQDRFKARDSLRGIENIVQ